MSDAETEFKRALRVYEQDESISDEDADIQTLMARHLRGKKPSACCEWIRSACLDRFVNEQVARKVLNGGDLPSVIVKAAAEAGLDISNDTES